MDYLWTEFIKPQKNHRIIHNLRNRQNRETRIKYRFSVNHTSLQKL